MATKKKEPPKANGGKAKTGEVLPATPDPELTSIVADGGAIAGFLANVGAFFYRAKELETVAQAQLSVAKTLVEPTTQEQDERLQRFIRSSSAGAKEIEAHWDICSVFHKMHRMLTARRGVGVQAYLDAAALAQKHHNTYTDKEKRRAAAEQERLRVEAENRARDQRNLELQAAEKQALDLEASSKDLSEREARFAHYVVLGMLPTPAARQAGYKNAELQGQSLMERPKIQAAIAAERQAIEIRKQAAAQRDAPLDVNVEIVKPAISKGGGYDRTTHSAVVLDEQALIAAVIGGKHGIPWDVLTVNPTKLNEYAGSLQERLNAWPGVQHKKNTKTI